MIVEELHIDICPVHNQKVTLKIGFSKKKASPNDIGFTYSYVGTCKCSLMLSGNPCPHPICPLVESRGLKRSIHE